MLHLEGKLFESLGCLVLVRRDYIGSSKFTIYQMRKGCSVWSSKYIVNTDDFMKPLPEGWSIRSIVWSIVLGEREEDSFIIINLSAKVVQYNLISRTLREIYDMGSNEISDDCLHGFIPPYAMHAFDYVYNPSTNLLKILPEPDYANVDSNVYGCAGLRLAFDPTKSPYYKVVRAGRTCSDIFIQIYCSEKGNWSLCNERFNYFFFLHFDSAMYWNNALHWLETENSQLTHYKLNIEYPDHPIITIIQIPQSLQQGRNFFKSYGNILPMIITIQIPHILHLEGKLFDSRGCLLLVRRDDFGSSKFTIYEMMKGSSVWSVRYHVDTDDFMTPLPEGWSIRSTVWSIVLGEREDDSFLVINLSEKVVEYNLISKNLREMYDVGSYQLTDDYHDGFISSGFIPPFAMYDMLPKQVDHKFAYWAPKIESMEVNSKSNPLEMKDAEGPSLDESLENVEHSDVDSCDSDSLKNVNNDSVSPSSRVLREEDVRGIESDLVDSFEEGEIRDDSVLYNDGCIKDCMEKNLEDDAGEILGVHVSG
ncbi:hypothetical protein Tco_0873117 [Tanacetum coccineum]